jgi:hypothetical protein
VGISDTFGGESWNRGCQSKSPVVACLLDEKALRTEWQSIALLYQLDNVPDIRNELSTLCSGAINVVVCTARQSYVIIYMQSYVIIYIAVSAAA